MYYGRPSFATAAAILVIFHTMAFVTTALRLWHRKQRSRLWWDDFWAFAALLSDIFLWTLAIAAPMGGTKPMSQSMRTFAKLGGLSAYTTALWASRISIAVTIVRLLNPGKFRSIAKAVTVLFGLFWLALVIQKIFPCGINSAALNWCSIPRVTGYIELGTDVLGDTWLILAPSYMLWTIKISHSHRRLIMSIFACSMLTIGVSAAHIYFILSQSVVWTGMTAHIQTGVSITVCNLLVLVTYIYRALFNAQVPAETATTKAEPQSGGQTHSGGVEAQETSPNFTRQEIPRTSTEPEGIRSYSIYGNTLNTFPSTALASQRTAESSYQSGYSGVFRHATV